MPQAGAVRRAWGWTGRGSQSATWRGFPGQFAWCWHRKGPIMINHMFIWSGCHKLYTSGMVCSTHFSIDFGYGLLLGLPLIASSGFIWLVGGGLNYQPVMILGSLTSVPGRMAGSAAYGPDRLQCAGGAVFESCHWMRNVCVCVRKWYIYIYNPIHLLQLTHRMAILGIFMCIRW